MKIGDLSRRTGISIRMLRYYEEQGLLDPSRTASGYRDYSDVHVRIVERIKLLSAGGMTLSTIAQFLPCIRGDRPIFEPCDELRHTLHAQIAAADERIRGLEKSRAVLATFLDEIRQDDV